MNKLIAGYTTNRHLLLDLDNTSYYKAKCIASEIMRCYPDVGDCLIVKCAENSWHLIYDNDVGWSRIMEMVECLAALNILEKGYMRIREFRGDLTLRISGKRTSSKCRLLPRPSTYLANPTRNAHSCLIFAYLDLLLACSRMHRSGLPEQPLQPEQLPDLHHSVQRQHRREILKRIGIWQFAAM